MTLVHMLLLFFGAPGGGGGGGGGVLENAAYIEKLKRKVK